MTVNERPADTSTRRDRRGWGPSTFRRLPSGRLGMWPHASLISARWTGVVLVLALCTPALVSAKVVDAEERRLAKQIKEAEREGFQRCELDTYFNIFTPDAKWTFGRRAVPDAHDYTLTTAAHRGQLEGRWKEGPSGKERVFFRSLEVSLTGESGTAEGELVRHFFGGSERLGRLYRLVKRGEHWRISAVRTWTLQTAFGADLRVYDDEYLLSRDEAAEKAKENPKLPFVERISRMVAAGWIATAYSIAVEALERKPKDVEALRARAQLAFSLGKLRDARRTAKTLRRLDPTIQLAPGL